LVLPAAQMREIRGEIRLATAFGGCDEGSSQPIVQRGVSNSRSIYGLWWRPGAILLSFRLLLVNMGLILTQIRFVMNPRWA